MEELDGAGGTDCAGGGGYTGGTGDGGEAQAENGNAGYNGTYHTTQYMAGGGYFVGGEGTDNNGLDRATLCLSGMYNQGAYTGLGHASGNGGTAGSGGTINVSSTATIYAYNGNLYTDGTSYEDGLNQCPIYAQNGIITAKYKYIQYNTSNVNQRVLLFFVGAGFISKYN